MNKYKAWVKILKNKKRLYIPHNPRRFGPKEKKIEKGDNKEEKAIPIETDESTDQDDFDENTFQIMRYDLPKLLSPIHDVEYLKKADKRRSNVQNIKQQRPQLEMTDLENQQPNKPKQERTFKNGPKNHDNHDLWNNN